MPKKVEARGRQDILDLGDIKTARRTEMLLPMWPSLMMKFGHPRFGFKVVKG